MSLRSKLAIASVASLLLVAGLCFLLLRTQRPPEQPGEERADPRAPVARAKGKVMKPAVARRAPEKKGAPPAALEPPPAQGKWLITGRVLKEDPQAGALVPAAEVTVLLEPEHARAKAAEAASRRVMTGPDGRFGFERVPGKEWWRIEIDEPSSASFALSFRFGEPEVESSRDLGDLLLEPATKLIVQLLGPSGEPAGKGRVLVVRKALMDSPVLASLGIEGCGLEAEEESPGTYVLERAARGVHAVEAVAPGCGEAREEVELPREEPLLIRLLPGQRIAGTVTAAEGAPIAGAAIEVLSGPGSPELAPRTTTDAKGAFSFDTLTQGEYVLGARADGFVSTRRREIASGTEDLAIVLEPEAVFSGTVVAEAGGGAVAKAEVKLRRADGQTLSDVSDDKGAFRVRGIGAGSYTVSASHPDFATLRQGPIDLRPADRIEGQVLALASGVAAVGKVVDSESDQPIGDAQVSFTSQKPEKSTKTARADAEGAFELKGLAMGKYEVRATARGYMDGKRQTVEVAAESAGDLTILLERGGSISGRVLDPSGRPIEAAFVQPSISSAAPQEWHEVFDDLSSVSARADSEGRYRLEGLPQHRSYAVKACAANFAPASVKDIAVGRGEDVEGVDLTLIRGGAIRGRVVDSGGAPIAGASIKAREELEGEPPMVYTAADGIGRSTTTDHDGNYALSPLNDGTFTVTCRARDRVSAKREKVKLAEGRSVEGIDFVLGEGEVLEGRVVDEDGNGIAGADVSAEGPPKVAARTDAEGRFRIGGLGAGSLTLLVQKRGFVKTKLEAAAPGRGLVVNLQLLARIAGKVESKGRDSLPIAQVIALPQGEEGQGPPPPAGAARSDPAGSFEVEVAPGTYILQATVRGFSPGRAGPITVQAGERKDGVVIPLVAGGTVSGVVVARGTGAPIEGVKVRSVSEDLQSAPGPDAATAKSGPDGTFRLEGMPARFSLIAIHPRYAQAVLSDLAVSAGQSMEVRLEMGSGAVIRGTVRSGGAPLAGAQVVAAIEGGGKEPGKKAKTDSSGRFELTGLSGGEYVVAVSGRAGASSRRSVSVAEGEAVEVDLAEGEGLRLFGRVTSAGAPVTGGSVRATLVEKGWTGEPSAIDASGGYSLELPSAGDYLVLVQAEGRGARLDVTVPDGATERRQDIDVAAGGLSGVVTDAGTGEPIHGAEVSAYADRPGPALLRFIPANLRGWAQTDESGRFDIAGLAAGRYLVRASADGYADGGVAGVRLVAEADPPLVELSLDQGLTLSALVVDESGQPVAQAQAICRDLSGGIPWSGEPARSREDGRLKIPGLRPGTYRMTVVHRAYAPTVLTVEAGSGAEPQVVIRPGGQVNVTVVDRRGRPVEGASLELLDEGGLDLLGGLLFLSLANRGQLQTGADGGIVLEPFPVGQHRLAASQGAARSREVHVQVEAGEAAGVRLTLER